MSIENKIPAYVITLPMTDKNLLPFISVALGVGGGEGSSGSSRLGLTLSGNTAWRDPSGGIHFTNASPKK